MKTQTRLQQYHNEEETQRCTDDALIRVKYVGPNKLIPQGAEVEAYFSAKDDVWYCRTPASKDLVEGEWFRAKPESLKGLME